MVCQDLFGGESGHVNKYRQDCVTGWVQHAACGKVLVIVRYFANSFNCKALKKQRNTRGEGSTQQESISIGFLLSLRPMLLLAAGTHVLTTQSLGPEATTQVSFSNLTVPVALYTFSIMRRTSCTVNKQIGFYKGYLSNQPK